MIDFIFLIIKIVFIGFAIFFVLGGLGLISEKIWGDGTIKFDKEELTERTEVEIPDRY